jgi:hypothetical protein
MGGGGGTGGSIGDIQQLVDRAKQELQKGGMTGKRNVFISFSYEDIGVVNLLRGQARNDNVPLVFNDWSVSEPIDSERSPYIKQKISERISQCSATVVFLSDSAAKSSWVDWEIEQTVKQGKHVIGVFPQGSEPTTKPPAFERHGIRAVAWPQLAEAIHSLD